MISAYYYMSVCHILKAYCMHMTGNWDFLLSSVISLLYSALLLPYDIYFQRPGDRHTNKENVSFMCNVNKA